MKYLKIPEAETSGTKELFELYLMIISLRTEELYVPF